MCRGSLWVGCGAAPLTRDTRLLSSIFQKTFQQRGDGQIHSKGRKENRKYFDFQGLTEN